MNRSVLFRVLGTAVVVTLLTQTATLYLSALENSGGFGYQGQAWTIFGNWLWNYLVDPAPIVALTGALPFYLGYNTPLFLPLAVAAGLAIGLRKRHPAATRLFAAAWAMAGLLIVAWVVFRGAGVWPGPLPRFAVPLVDVAGVTFCYLLILRPLHRAEAPAQTLWAPLPTVTLIAFLILLTRVFHGETLSACAQIFGGVFQEAMSAHQAGLTAGVRDSAEWQLWPQAIITLLLLFISPLLVVRGLTVRAAFVVIWSGLRRRPLFGLGSVLLLVVAAQCAIVPMVFFQIFSWSRGPGNDPILFCLLGGICTGLLGGFWIWLQARAALALADAGAEGNA